MSNRRRAFADLLPGIIRQANAVRLSAIYSTVELDHPHLVDEEIEPPPSHGLRWKHDLRWELETLVVKGVVRRRKDLGRGIYSA